MDHDPEPAPGDLQDRMWRSGWTSCEGVPPAAAPFPSPSSAPGSRRSRGRPARRGTAPPGAPGRPPERGPRPGAGASIGRASARWSPSATCSPRWSGSGSSAPRRPRGPTRARSTPGRRRRGQRGEPGLLAVEVPELAVALDVPEAEARRLLTSFLRAYAAVADADPADAAVDIVHVLVGWPRFHREWVVADVTFSVEPPADPA